MKKLILITVMLLAGVLTMHAQQTGQLPEAKEKGEFALRLNLPYVLTGTPFVGFEWKPTEKVGLLLNGAWSDWSLNEGQTRWAVWQINPEFRYYLNRCWYLGVSGEYGNFDVKPGKKKPGYDGQSMWAAGVVAGYKARLSPRLDLDFNVGLGYAEYAFDEYERVNGQNVVTYEDDYRYLWGPYQATIALSWKIGK